MPEQPKLVWRRGKSTPQDANKVWRAHKKVGLHEALKALTEKFDGKVDIIAIRRLG